MKHTLCFMPQKIITTEYLLKEQNITIDIDIEVLTMKIDENLIDIEYLIKGSENKLKYKIEMSDKI